MQFLDVNLFGHPFQEPEDIALVHAVSPSTAAVLPLPAQGRGPGVGAYSTVTVLARLRGWSTSLPSQTAIS